MSHHRIALRVILAALGLDALAGFLFSAVEHLPAWHGLYWALATAVTVGDVAPVTGWGHVVAAAVCLTVVPLFAATFSLFTSGLTAVHVDRAEGRIKAHVETRLKAHLGVPPAPGSRKLRRPGGDP